MSDQAQAQPPAVAEAMEVGAEAKGIEQSAGTFARIKERVSNVSKTRVAIYAGSLVVAAGIGGYANADQVIGSVTGGIAEAATGQSSSDSGSTSASSQASSNRHELNNINNKMNADSEGANAKEVMHHLKENLNNPHREVKRYELGGINNMNGKVVNGKTGLTIEQRHQKWDKFLNAPNGKNTYTTYTGHVKNGWMKNGGQTGMEDAYYDHEQVMFREVPGMGKIGIKVTLDKDGERCFNFFLVEKPQEAKIPAAQITNQISKPSFTRTISFENTSTTSVTPIPGKPGSPSRPVSPAKPGQPVSPQQPDQPQQPQQPEQPQTPEQPEQPPEQELPIHEPAAGPPQEANQKPNPVSSTGGYKPGNAEYVVGNQQSQPSGGLAQTPSGTQAGGPGSSPSTGGTSQGTSNNAGSSEAQTTTSGDPSTTQGSSPNEH